MDANDCDMLGSLSNVILRIRPPLAEIVLPLHFCAMMGVPPSPSICGNSTNMIPEKNHPNVIKMVFVPYLRRKFGLNLFAELGTPFPNLQKKVLPKHLQN